MTVECPKCLQATAAEGWLHPSCDYPGLLHCNCCGQYYIRNTGGTLVPFVPGEKARSVFCSTVVGG